MDGEGFPLPPTGNMDHEEQVVHPRGNNRYSYIQQLNRTRRSFQGTNRNNRYFQQVNRNDIYIPQVNRDDRHFQHIIRLNQNIQTQDITYFHSHKTHDINQTKEEATDQESGEATNRQIMVLRKPPLYKFRNRQNTQIGGYASQLSPTLAGRRRRIPRSVRIPKTDSDKRHPTRETQRFCINVWKEFVLGRGVLHPKLIKFDHLKNDCDTWYKLCSAYVETIRSCSYYLLWIKRLFLLILRICVPAIGAKLIFCHFTWIHWKIHKEDNEKNLNAKFCGAPFGGVTLFAIRALYCPYCRSDNDTRMTLKYFESIAQECRKQKTN